MDRILTDTELKEKGWSIEVLRQEIRSGRLKAKDWGTGFSVTEEAFDQWHASESGQTISNGFPASGPGPARHQHHTAPTGSGEQWRQMCSDLIAAGAPSHIAAAAASKRFPGGREQLVTDTADAAQEQRVRERAESFARYATKQNKGR